MINEDGAGYIHFKGIELYNWAGVLAMGCEGHAIPISARLYMSGKTSISDLTKAIDLESKGQFDYAVPQSWLDEQIRFKQDTKAVWFYPRDTKEEGHIFGRPFYVHTMILELKRLVDERITEIILKQDELE